MNNSKHSDTQNNVYLLLKQHCQNSNQARNMAIITPIGVALPGKIIRLNCFEISKKRNKGCDQR